jgi:hypothetical protein
MKTSQLPTGPTLNPSYNGLFLAWAKECDVDCRGRYVGIEGCTCGAKKGTKVCTPECEDCGADLTGQQVYETSTSWLGECCAPDEIVHADDEEDHDETQGDWRDYEPVCYGRSREDGYEDFHADG